jgi:hypothetical protein
VEVCVPVGVAVRVAVAVEVGNTPGAVVSGVGVAVAVGIPAAVCVGVGVEDGGGCVAVRVGVRVAVAVRTGRIRKLSVLHVTYPTSRHTQTLYSPFRESPNPPTSAQSW